jgi:hypothetical protein
MNLDKWVDRMSAVEAPPHPPEIDRNDSVDVVTIR